MKPSELEEVLETCTLCPGICVSSCPVFLSSRVRAASPNAMARVVLKGLRSNRVDYLKSAFYCNYCKTCEERCPLGNKLADALMHIRSKIMKDTKVVIPSPVDLGGRGKKVLIASPVLPNENAIDILKERFRLYWLNTNELTFYYWYGILNLKDLRTTIRNSFDYVLLEDIDIPLIDMNQIINDYTEVLKSVDLDANYILHVPCKLEKNNVIRSLERILSKSPIKIIDLCSGALLIRDARNISNLILRTFKKLIDNDTPVITLCRRAQEVLKEQGIRSCTPLDLLGLRTC